MLDIRISGTVEYWEVEKVFKRNLVHCFLSSLSQRGLDLEYLSWRTKNTAEQKVFFDFLFNVVFSYGVLDFEVLDSKSCFDSFSLSFFGLVRSLLLSIQNTHC